MSKMNGVDITIKERRKRQRKKVKDDGEKRFKGKLSLTKLSQGC